LITKLYGYLWSNSLLFYGGLFGVFSFTGLFAPTFFTQVLNEVNQNLLAVFSTYYLWIGLISVIAALVILCLPLRKQRLGNETQLILILAGLLCTVLEWVQDYCYERFKSLLII
jgi:glycine betaine transporter